MAAPEFFTVEEAARILRIGRTAAYLAAKRFRETDGAEGLPCVAIRGSLRVPRRRLEVMAGGPIEATGSAEVTSLADRRGPSTAPTTKPKRTSQDSQATLPFTG